MSTTQPDVPAPPRPPPAPPAPVPPAVPARTPSPRACAALAVIGKKNRPLAFRVYDINSDAYLRNLVLCSLDVVDECAQAQENSRDEFLGAATTVDGRELYASRTATGITLCAVLDAALECPRRTSGPASRTRERPTPSAWRTPSLNWTGARSLLQSSRRASTRPCDYGWRARPCARRLLRSGRRLHQRLRGNLL